MVQPAQKSLLIVGASARAAAQSALRAGLSPVCVDLFADADLAHVCPVFRAAQYPEDLPALSASHPPGPWMYTGAVENYPHVIQAIAAERPLWGVGGRGLLAARDPWSVAHAMSRHGLPTPALASGQDSLPSDGRWLVKRLSSAGGQHVRVWNGEWPITEGKSHYLQERINGTPCSALFVVGRNATVLLGATEQLAGQPWHPRNAFGYGGSVGPLDLSVSLKESLKRVGAALLEMELVGLIGVDFIRCEASVAPIEINPRYTASVEILERATAVHSVELHAQASRGESVVNSTESPPATKHGKAILFAERSLHVSREITARLLARNQASSWPVIADIPAGGSEIQPGWPILTVFSAGSSLEGVKAGLRERLAEMRCLLYGEH